MSQHELSQFFSLMPQLIGLVCWNVMAGAVGSLASLDFGAMVARDKPLPYPNVKLTPDEHKFRGEYVLYLEYCPWRLDSADAVIASWNDSNAPKGPIITGLRQLIGTKIAYAEIISPGLDLILRFENGHVLRVFPDVAERDDGDNYSLSIANGPTYIVGPRSRLRVE